MRRLHLPPVVRYVLAALAVALTTAGLNALRDILNTPTIALLYLLPVTGCAAWWGLGAGLTAALSAFLALNYFFIPPYYTFGVHHSQDALGLGVFLAMTVMISDLVNRARNSLGEAQAREREAVYLYQLSTELAGLHTPEEIAQTVAERLRGILLARIVEVMVLRGSQGKPVTIRMPAEGAAAADAGRPDLLFPVQGGPALLGEIRVWRGTIAPGLPEGRVLQTFASQATLALERATLAEAETRAKVLEESDRMKSALLSSVSHELRTPLATIKAAATSLRSGTVDWESPARADLLEAVEEESDHLNRLVGNLLDMSRIEAGVLRPQRQWNLLADIVDSTVTRMRRAAEQHSLEIDIPEDLPLMPVDALQIEQVFANLIDNSLKYAPSGTTIRVRAWQESADTLHVMVSNQGPPVPEEDLEHIFDKFHRVTAADKVTGTGLGLSICKGIVVAHGGRIWAENLEHGFAFHFTLPLVWEGVAPPRLPIEPGEPAATEGA